MRLFTASIGTESNTFSPVPTSLEDYAQNVLYRAGEHPNDGPKQCTAQLWVARRRAARDGFALVEGSCFFASPGGRTNSKDHVAMRDEILDQLRAAMPVDGVLLGMHGAMVAFGEDDVEGDLLERARAIVGPDVPIAVELDPHCHLTLKRVSLADIIVLYKEYPHTDTVERAEELLDLLLGTLGGRIRPVMSVYDCRQIGSFPTTHPLMRAFVDRAAAMEGKDGILSVSIGHCYPYADVPEMGARILVVADGDKAAADRAATLLGQEFQALRGVTTPKFHGVEDGIDTALAMPGAPIAVTDAADNAGGGASSDNTTILRALLARGTENVAVGPLWDPVAVRTLFAAGLGAELPLRFGGKTGPTSGTPIDATVRVTGLAREATQTYGATQSALGDLAAIRVGGIDVVLNTARTQALGLELFTAVGIDPRARKLLVLKSSNHFRAAYDPILAGVLHIHSDGLLRRDDYRLIPYLHVKRPIWPLDEEASGCLIA
jgi:microcystin degradation protein MlrC